VLIKAKLRIEYFPGPICSIMTRTNTTTPNDAIVNDAKIKTTTPPRSQPLFLRRIHTEMNPSIDDAICKDAAVEMKMSCDSAHRPIEMEIRSVLVTSWIASAMNKQVDVIAVVVGV